MTSSLVRKETLLFTFGADEPNLSIGTDRSISLASSNNDRVQTTFICCAQIHVGGIGVAEFKTPTRPVVSGAPGGESPREADADPDIIWDATSPRRPRGKRAKHRAPGPVSISDIVSRIAPEVSDSRLVRALAAVTSPAALCVRACVARQTPSVGARLAAVDRRQRRHPLHARRSAAQKQEDVAQVSWPPRLHQSWIHSGGQLKCPQCQL